MLHFVFVLTSHVCVYKLANFLGDGGRRCIPQGNPLNWATPSPEQTCMDGGMYAVQQAAKHSKASDFPPGAFTATKKRWLLT